MSKTVARLVTGEEANEGRRLSRILGYVCGFLDDIEDEDERGDEGWQMRLRVSAFL